MQNFAIIKGNHLRKVLGHGGIYVASSLVTKGMNVILLPVYTRYLSPADYGALQNILAMASFIGIFMSLYIDNAIARFYFDYTQDLTQLRKLVSTSVIFVVLWGLIIGLASLFVLRQIGSDITNLPWFPFAFLTCLIALLNQLSTLAIALLRQSHQSVSITIASLINLSVNVAISLWLLIGQGWKVDARLWGIASAGLVFNVILYFILFRKGNISFTFSGSILKEILSYSIGLLPLTASSWIFNLSDRILLAIYGSTTDTGLYSAAYQIGSQLQIVYLPIFYVYGPMMFAMFTENPEEGRDRVARFVPFFWYGLLITTFALSLFAQEIMMLLTAPEFHTAFYLIPIIAVAFLFMGFRKLFATVLYYHKKTWLISSIGILQAVSNFGLNVVFIPLFGSAAAAWTTLWATLLGFVFYFFLSQRLEPLKLDYKSLAIPVGILIGCLLIYLLFEELVSPSDLIILVAAKSGVFILGIGLILFYRKQDLLALRKALIQPVVAS